MVNKIQQLRVKAGLTREQLAVAASISFRYVEALERGERKEPGVSIALRIAATLGVRPEEIWPTTPDEPEPAGVRGQAESA